ncbi:MAG: hypothetical protein HFG83_12735 [Dorea sp.]|nr:hypothetical protein [Dorea sp.]
MIIQTNIPALYALREKKNTDNAIAKNLQKLSSGFRIRQAADDAAGLAVSEKMRAQITELERCELNVSEGIDIAQTADGALEEVGGMLRRARELCLQASNGTYSDRERRYMSEEINQLFGEIEHITSSSRYNTIPLFQSIPTDSNDPVYLYVEEFNKAADQQLWGEMDFVKNEDFDPPVPAKPATVTFQLEDGIGMNYAIMLDKKSIKIGSTTYTFRADRDQNSSGNPSVISLKGIQTVREAMEQLAKFSDIQKVEVDEAAHTVTLTGSLNDYSYPVEANGTTTHYWADKGDGTYKNGWTVQNPEGKETINEVDGSGIANNQPVYGKELSLSYNMSNVKDPIDVANLRRNSLNIYISGANPSSASISYADIFTQTTGTITKEFFINTVMSKLRTTPPLDSANTTIKYTSPNLEISTSLPASASSGTQCNAYISESTQSKQEDTTKPSWKTNSLAFTTSSTPPSAEVGGTFTVKIPDVSSFKVPFSFQLGSYNHVFYDSKNPATPIKTDGTTMFSTGDYYTNTHDISGKSPAEIRAEVVKMIKNYRGGSVKEQGNELIFSSNPNTSAPRFNIQGCVVEVKAAIPPSTAVLSGSRVYFSQEVSVPFTLEKPFDASKLIGTGFGISNGNGGSMYRWEFTDGTDLRSDYYDIDISGCKSFTDLAAVMETAIRAKGSFGNDCEVRVDESKTPASLTIEWRRQCSSYQVSVSDGAEGVSGIVKDGPVQFSGGTIVGHEQKVLDFSSINTNNLDTLLGKGFRVNCATCEGEYINVYFCWQNDGSAPPSFTHNVTINGQNVTRTIHNIPVELSKVTSGDQIVKSIVDQVKPSLNHYTDMEVGDPSTSLVIRDKRLGIVYDNTTGQEYIGSVESGVFTNFTYTVTKEEIAPPEPPEGELLDFRHCEVMIYAGHNPEPEMIPIHLPFLSLTQLRLNPPKLVDLTDKDQHPLGLLKKIDCAHDSIADSRAVMGADYNRLEHAYQALAHTTTNLQDAESRIRDADMAGLMMEKIKNDILSQPQQSIIAQASKRPELVLQLLH